MLRKTTVALLSVFYTVVAFAAAPADSPECTSRASQLAGKCGMGSPVPRQFLSQCADLQVRFKEFDKQKSELVTKCSSLAIVGNRKAGRKSRGDQANANRDTSELLAKNKELMSSCAKEMARLKAEIKAITATLKKELHALQRLNPPQCKDAALAMYQELLTQAEEREQLAEKKEEEYKKGVEATETPGAANNANADNMDSQNKPAGGGGGGMPQMPQIPPKKNDDSSKKAAEEAAKLKAQRLAQCTSDRSARETKKANCKVEFPVLSSAPVADYQQKQKDCIDRADADYSARWGSIPCEQLQ